MNWSAIFDWDGVILDSSACHEKSWEKLALEENRGLPDGHFKKGFGMKNEIIIPEILNWTEDAAEIHRLSERKESLYRELLLESGIRPLPGVINFLNMLAGASIPCVIGSSTTLVNIRIAMEELGLEGRFQAIVSGEDVGRGKPHPEVFLKAAQKSGQVPHRCIVFEDAPAGVQAAHAGGMKAVAVTTTNPAATLREADRVVDRLDELSLDALAKLLEGRQKNHCSNNSLDFTQYFIHNRR